MMIANEWSDFDAGETGACYLWPSWSDRRGFVTVRRLRQRVEIRLEYRGPVSGETQSDLTISGAGESELYNNWLAMLRKLTATHPGMDGDYGIFINAVSGTVAAFAGSGAR